MVSSVGNNSLNNAVSQVIQKQLDRVDVQRTEQAAEQRRQEKITLVEETKAAQRQSNSDERRGGTIDIRV